MPIGLHWQPPPNRRDFSPKSDVDLLYTASPAAQWGWNIVDLRNELAELLGRPVHLVSRPGGSAAFAVLVDGGDAHALVARLHHLFSPRLRDGFGEARLRDGFGEAGESGEEVAR